MYIVWGSIQVGSSNYCLVFQQVSTNLFHYPAYSRDKKGNVILYPTLIDAMEYDGGVEADDDETSYNAAGDGNMEDEYINPMISLAFRNTGTN